MRKVKYAGSEYQVIYEGERVFHLRSTRDPSLVISCPVKSVFIKELESEKDNKEIIERKERLSKGIQVVCKKLSERIDFNEEESNENLSSTS